MAKSRTYVFPNYVRNPDACFRIEHFYESASSSPPRHATNTKKEKFEMKLKFSVLLSIGEYP